MSFDDLSVMRVLQQTMHYNAQRQNLVGENVANANTPNYTPKDIPRSEFERALSGALGPSPSVELVRTHANHIAGPSTGSRSYAADDSPDSETTINGNSVVVEEQMVRQVEARMTFETALTLYQKNLSMLRVAARGPNG